MLIKRIIFFLCPLWGGDITDASQIWNATQISNATQHGAGLRLPKSPQLLESPPFWWSSGDRTVTDTVGIRSFIAFSWT